LSSAADGFDVRTLAALYHAGTRLAEHRHSWGQLVFGASGVMRVRAAGAEWLIPPTRAIWLPAGLNHSITMHGEVAMRTLYIDRPRAEALPDAPHVLAVAPLLREVILHILGIGMLDPVVPAHDRLGGVLIDLILAAAREDLMLPWPVDPRARRLAAHWQRHPEEAQDLAALARMAGASLRSLQRIFPAETGFTLEAWRQRARLIHAVADLAAGASVTEAALGCGYQSAAAFGAAFVRMFGVSPGRYVGGDRSTV